MERKRKGREGKIQPVEVLLKQAMPPLYEIREKLEKVEAAWDSVVGPVLGRQSAPLDIENGEFLIMTESPLVGNRVVMMGGNIARILSERWRLEVKKVRVVVGRLPLKEKGSSRKGDSAARSAAVRVREEDVKEFESRCLEMPDFPQDAAEPLARLRAFFMKRFG